jgi:Uncharacterised nucleotidyltransferase
VEIVESAPNERLFGRETEPLGKTLGKRTNAPRAVARLEDGSGGGVQRMSLAGREVIDQQLVAELLDPQAESPGLRIRCRPRRRIRVSRQRRPFSDDVSFMLTEGHNVSPSAGRGASRRLLLRAALAPPSVARLAFGAWRSRERAALTCLPAPERSLVPLLSSRLADLGASSEDVQAGRELFRDSWARNQVLASNAADAAGVLRAAGLPVILLKGAALAFCAYASPGLRPMRDVDLLVPHDGARRARLALERAGWCPAERHHEAFLDSIHALAFRGPQGVEIDLHWHALLERPAARWDRLIFDSASAISWPGGAALAPSPEAHLLLVAVHSQRWSPSPHLIGVADLVALLGRLSPVGQAEVARAARAMGLQPALSRALAAAEDACPGAVPKCFRCELLRDPSALPDRLEACLRRRPPGLLSGLTLHGLAYRREIAAASDEKLRCSFAARMRHVWGVPAGRSVLGEALRRAIPRVFGRAVGW